MIKFIRDALTSGSNNSSSRIINLGGFIVGTLLLGYQTYMTGLTYDLFGVYMGYCSLTYVGGKYVGNKVDAYVSKQKDTNEGEVYDDRPPYNHAY